MKNLTVAELLEILSKLPPELPVLVEGCDCYQAATNVDQCEDTSDVLYLPPAYVLIGSVRLSDVTRG